MSRETSEPETYWDLSSEELIASLKSSADGLSEAEAAKRLEAVGLNRLSAKEQATGLSLFLNQFKSPIILILLFATALSAYLQDWPDALIILLIVMGSALLSFWQEFNANNAAASLRARVSMKSTVVRGGKQISAPSETLVPGDIVLLSAGSLIPADGIVLEAKDFFVNQAVLTGETYPVEKSPGQVAAETGLAGRTNMVFMGTNVRSGSARVILAQTGIHTAFGHIASRLTLRPPETEFERGIKGLGYLLSEIMLIMVLAIFVLNVISRKPVIDSLLFSIALAVGLTPQLLPAIININLSKGSQAMAHGGVIVRRLESIENFGSMDILCTDKTGTLTQGEMKLDASLDPQGEPSESVFRLAYMNAKFQSGLPNPLDEAVIAKAQPELSGVTKVDEIPYDFERRRLSVVVEENQRRLLVTKGALANLLAVCTQVQSGEKVLPLDEKQISQIQGHFGEWSTKGFRVLGVAQREAPADKQTFSDQDERDLCFVGFLLFFDPPKEGVQETISQLQGLGVQLKIITGDNRLVALHTAQAVGLENPQVLTGSQLDKLRAEALWHAAERTTIFAEVDPNQKERIILALKRTGHVVGYLGDGINDAPSLHSADVGISVENAVDVAKESADLVLLKQDLGVLQQGIVQGRKTFANTLKYVFMAVSANFGNMFSVAAASLFLPFLPMLPKQILLINFLTDLPEMTIAGDNVDQTYIERPHRWDINFIRRFMLIFGPISSIFDILTFAALLFFLKADPQTFHTGWFIESVLSACLVVFALRTRLPATRSKPSRAMVWVSILVMLVALALPYTPLAAVLGFKPLSPAFLLVILAIIVIYFMGAELTKRWFYRRFG